MRLFEVKLNKMKAALLIGMFIIAQYALGQGGQSDSVIAVPVISDIGERFQRIIENHISLERDSGLDNQTSIFIQIDRRVPLGIGVPTHIIDSIYSENNFPLNKNWAGYEIGVMSQPINFSGNCNLKDTYQSIYLYHYGDKLVLIVSVLDIKFPTSGKGVVKVCGSKQALSVYEYGNVFSAYTWRVHGLDQVWYKRLDDFIEDFPNGFFIKKE